VAVAGKHAGAAERARGTPGARASGTPLPGATPSGTPSPGMGAGAGAGAGTPEGQSLALRLSSLSYIARSNLWLSSPDMPPSSHPRQGHTQQPPQQEGSRRVPQGPPQGPSVRPGCRTASPPSEGPSAGVPLTAGGLTGVNSGLVPAGTAQGRGHATGDIVPWVTAGGSFLGSAGDDPDCRGCSGATCRPTDRSVEEWDSGLRADFKWSRCHFSILSM